MTFEVFGMVKIILMMGS